VLKPLLFGVRDRRGAYDVYDCYHRDIRAENILMVSTEKNNPRIKLSDFGFSRYGFVDN